MFQRLQVVEHERGLYGLAVPVETVNTPEHVHAACKSTVVQANPTTVTGATSPRRFMIEFPMDGCSSSPNGMLLRIRSRWINEDSSDPGFGQPWITPVPPARDVFQGGP